MFDGAHFGYEVRKVGEGQQAAASEHELRGGWFRRDQRFDIFARHKAPSHGFSQLIQDQHVDLANLLARQLHDLCGTGFGRVAVGLYDAKPQSRSCVMFGAVQLLGKLKHNLIYFAVFSVAAYIINLFVPKIFISGILRYAVFYAVGIFIYKYYDAFKKYILNPYCSSAMLILFCVTHIFRLKTDYTVTCLSASIFILFLSQSIMKFKDKTKIIYTVFNELGTYSYDIYLLSYFIQVPLRVLFKSIFPIPELLLYVLMFTLGTIIPYLASKFILRKVPIFNLLLFGNKRKAVKSNG